MTIHIDARNFAGFPFRAPGPFARALNLLTAGVRTGWERFLRGLHESRRKQAAVELWKHRPLIFDPTTGIAFGVDATARASTPPE